MRICCDFDGTISCRDTTDLVLEALAEPRWRLLEQQWLDATISAAECMRLQVELIGGSEAELLAVLETVQLDPGFARFLAWCDERGLPVSIVSDGVDYFIDYVLKRHGLDRPIIANRLLGEPGAWRLDQPAMRPGCAAGSGVCKCSAAAALGQPGRAETLVYVGDGRSDFCISAKADVLFAKGALADYATDRGQPFHPFETFHDVTAALATLVGASPLPAARAVSL